MTKQVKLSNEERQILSKLSNPQLLFLKRVAEDKEFQTLRDIVNVLIDVEKNIFFGENEASLTSEVLYAKHAYARGGIAKLVTLIRLLVGSSDELSVREEERKKRIKKE